MSDVAISDLVDDQKGFVHSLIFTDSVIYRRELEHVFARSWLFVAHESEIPRPGDFVMRNMGEDPVIVSRGSDNTIRILLNSCRHRGRMVCVEDFGNTSHFRCGYHGWTYTNAGELVGLPFHDAYQGRLDRGTVGLYEAPHVDTYHGLIFGNWDPDAASLDANLGEMKWVLDILFGRSAAVEVVGPPKRWIVETNWKVPAGNFAGDNAHVFTTHGFRAALHMETMKGRPETFIFPTENGHTVDVASWPQEAVGRPPYLALPEELMPELREHLTPEQLGLVKSLFLIVGNLFPNMSFLQTASHTPQEWGGPEGRIIPFLTIRQWQPKGPTQTEVWSWFLVDKNAPEWWKEASRQCYHRVFGTAGIFEQDDTENWSAISGGLRGVIGQRGWLRYDQGMDHPPSKEWPGPGVAYLPHGPSEINERKFYSHWQQLIADGKETNGA